MFCAFERERGGKWHQGDEHGPYCEDFIGYIEDFGFYIKVMWSHEEVWNRIVTWSHLRDSKTSD